MNDNACDNFRNRLVDYADGELPPDESTEVAEHVATCSHCREILAALRKSIELAGVIWQQGEADLAHVRVPDRPQSHRFRWLRPASIAACIVLLIGASLVWRAASRPSLPNAAEPNTETIAEIERTVARAGVAMELLGAAEYLNEQPGGQEIARERFHYIVSAYPETEAAAACRSRLGSL